MDISIIFGGIMNQKPKKIFILGMMGVGKTTIAKRLANHLGWTFYDTDQMIEEMENMSVSEIFASKGEHFFRAKEVMVLANLKSLDRVVVSLGGGFPCHSNNMDALLKLGWCVYLTGTPAFIASRLKGSNLRPLLANANSKDDIESRLNDLLLDRSPIYEKADITVGALNISLDDLIKRINITPE
ncbi:MAG: shikimate kinase [Salibacteraceae bacterium]